MAYEEKKKTLFSILNLSVFYSLEVCGLTRILICNWEWIQGYIVRDVSRRKFNNVTAAGLFLF